MSKKLTVFGIAVLASASVAWGIVCYCDIFLNPVNNGFCNDRDSCGGAQVCETIGCRTDCLVSYPGGGYLRVGSARCTLSGTGGCDEDHGGPFPQVP